MGGIGIWGMHFVGNRAIVLANGNPERQILYNQGFTALSFFMPIMVLLFAFYYLGMPTRARQLHVAFAGVLTGAAVCGMHYLGQLGVDNYSCSYRVQNVVGAAIIAVVASFTALSVFFRLRDSWTDSWWKRALCGGILAIAVSGMHWTAAAGTIYHWKGDLSSHGDSIGQTAIIAAALVRTFLGVKDPILTCFTVDGLLRDSARGCLHPWSQQAYRQNQSSTTGPRMCLFRRRGQIDGHSRGDSAQPKNNQPLRGEGEGFDIPFQSLLTCIL